ncbi:DUF1254 domain-containing protein [Paraburkholderia sp. J12]|uniref:DUF1254 domain-containing protein n=1 Tax=Paraburkholderia sp. J12 TaxID=2805432 RepID=UPI002ABE70A0|nr:DUF1254 domain-containing protein [Paraburkholderia sp. J12]
MTSLALAAGATSAAITVTPDNFVRAESDFYFSRIVKDDGFGHFHHARNLPDVHNQLIIRLNRDTLYSAAVVDLDAGPATVTVPAAGERFLSMQVINEDHYTVGLIHEGGTYRFSRKEVGTRYVLFAVRMLVNANDPRDIDAVHALQDRLEVHQAHSGVFDIPDWDSVSRDKVRGHLVALATMLPDTNDMFGSKEEVTPIHHLLGTAFGWGGNPEKEATYLNVVPKSNDGRAVYRLHVGQVPVDGFWSISVYNANGYYEPNALNAYTLNSVVARKEADGSVNVQFGGCDNQTVNCIPTPPGWNYTVRLYRPRQAILDKSWTFPQAQLVTSGKATEQPGASEQENRQ